jgi:hypothetical protein
MRRNGGGARTIRIATKIAIKFTTKGFLEWGGQLLRLDFGMAYAFVIFKKWD